MKSAAEWIRELWPMDNTPPEDSWIIPHFERIQADALEAAAKVADEEGPYAGTAIRALIPKPEGA